ncbi:MAG: hypothetical protein AAGF12_18550 [Myxococcota bacterium]
MLKATTSAWLLVSSVLVGCSDNDPDPISGMREAGMPDSAESSADGAADGTVEDPCLQTLLESDFGQEPLVGPIVDPMTGAVADPEDGSYLVATTYLALQGRPESMDAFNEIVGAITTALATQDGLLAVSTGGSGECGTARTLTVWRDQGAMATFVTGPAHIQAIQRVGEISRGGSSTHTFEVQRGADVSWARATQELEGVEPTY